VTATAERVIAESVLEDLANEQPPGCEALWAGINCGAPVAWKATSCCEACGKVSKSLVCNRCRQILTRPDCLWTCKPCDGPLTVIWMPV
jgi:hypothetical protein